MGSWGYKALESDEGLDILDFFSQYTERHHNLQLGAVISAFQEEGFLAETDDDIDFLYDKTAIALSEIYISYQSDGKFLYGDKKLKIESFRATKNDLQLLIIFLQDILKGKPDKDGDREYLELYQNVNGWIEHMNYLITSLDNTISNMN